jgi:hypothetical protein
MRSAQQDGDRICGQLRFYFDFQDLKDGIQSPACLTFCGGKRD